MHFDDSLEIAEELIRNGILVYHLSTSSSKKFKPKILEILERNDPRISHPSFPSFPEAVNFFIRDFHSGALYIKLKALEEAWDRAVAQETVSLASAS